MNNKASLICSHDINGSLRSFQLQKALFKILPRRRCNLWGLLKKWSLCQERKSRLMLPPLLVFLDLKKHFEINYNASGKSLGAVLLQEGHLNAYKSHCLNDHEQSLEIYEKEFLVVLQALVSWEHNFLGIAFSIHNYHQNIRYFMTQVKLSKKKMQWKKFLLQFHLQIFHILEKKNIVDYNLCLILKTMGWCGFHCIKSWFK